MEGEEIVRVARLWLGDDGIVRIKHLPGAEMTLEDAKETMSAFLKITKGKICPIYCDTTQQKAMTREARNYYASEEAAKVASAVAIIVGTPVSRVLGNFYIGLSRPLIPSRIFTSEEEALDWLKGFLK